MLFTLPVLAAPFDGVPDGGLPVLEMSADGAACPDVALLAAEVQSAFLDERMDEVASKGLQLDAGLACTAEPLDVPSAAAVHRGLALAAHIAGDEPGAVLLFAAALRLEPEWTLPDSWDGTRTAGVVDDARVLSAGAVLVEGCTGCIVDGRWGAERPRDLPTLIQRTQRGRVVETTLEAPIPPPRDPGSGGVVFVAPGAGSFFGLTGWGFEVGGGFEWNDRWTVLTSVGSYSVYREVPEEMREADGPDYVWNTFAIPYASLTGSLPLEGPLRVAIGPEVSVSPFGLTFSGADGLAAVGARVEMSSRSLRFDPTLSVRGHGVYAPVMPQIEDGLNATGWMTRVSLGFSYRSRR